MKRLYTLILAVVTLLSVAAAPIDEAKRLYNEGEYEQALEKLQALHNRSPRDGNVNYWLGMTLIALDCEEDAIQYLQTAQDRNVADAALRLGMIEMKQYHPEEARAHFDVYERLQKRAKREIAPEVTSARSKLVLMQNMLSRVEKIVIIDSLVVDAEAFFTHYRLSPESGRFVIGATMRMPDVEVAYIPQNNTEMFYAAADTAGLFELMHADILDDGTIDAARSLDGEALAGGGNAEYPFLLSDGLTLYFANDGEESLGGYDIFMTRRDEDGFLQPQNIGMPYNSLDDDYLLAIDETTGAGWWATDRNHIPGMVTIYIFVPNDTRINIDPDDENLTELARLSDISLTQIGADYQAVQQRISAISEYDNGDDTSSAAFDLPIASTNVVYHNLSDFRNSKARAAMTKALNERAKITNLTARLDTLRENYRQGDRSQATTILNLEQQLREARVAMRLYINEAIRLEANL